jgi:hypothetical protein
MKIAYGLFFLLVQVITLSAHAAEESASERAAEEPLKVLDLVPNQNWEKEKRNTLAGKYYEKALELKKTGKYTDALYFLVWLSNWSLNSSRA